MQDTTKNKSFRIPEGYSAGLMSQSFWFLEFKKTAKLRQGGFTYDEIKRTCVEKNLFGAAKAYRAARMSGYLIARLKAMDDDLLALFCEADMATQKLIHLICVLSTDRLFFEFVYEVYREKVQIGAAYLEDSDINAFFTRKEAQNDLIASWKDSTKKHLRANYSNFMREANLLTAEDGQKRITPPILDTRLEEYLKAAHAEAFIRALTGVN